MQHPILTHCTTALTAIVLALGVAIPAAAQQGGSIEEILNDIDVLDATPPGSWARYESVEYDKKGRGKTASTMTNKFLSRETVDGVDHMWLEMEMQSYKIGRNGERKADGKPMVMKVLVEESFFSQGGGNIGALRGFGKEMIMQQGDETPMRMTNVGAMAAGLGGMAEVNMDGTYERHGTVDVDTPAGSFDAVHVSGTQQATVGVAMLKRTITSDIELWVSPDVPFATVRNVFTEQGRSARRTEMILQEYGTSGAASAITGTPEDIEMPAMPGLKDMLPGN